MVCRSTLITKKLFRIFSSFREGYIFTHHCTENTVAEGLEAGLCKSCWICIQTPDLKLLPFITSQCFIVQPEQTDCLFGLYMLLGCLRRFIWWILTRVVVKNLQWATVTVKIQHSQRELCIAVLLPCRFFSDLTDIFFFVGFIAVEGKLWYIWFDRKTSFPHRFSQNSWLFGSFANSFLWRQVISYCTSALNFFDSWMNTFVKVACAHV